MFPLQKYKKCNKYTLKHCLAKFSVNQYSLTNKAVCTNYQVPTLNYTGLHNKMKLNTTSDSTKWQHHFIKIGSFHDK